MAVDHLILHLEWNKGHHTGLLRLKSNYGVEANWENGKDNSVASSLVIQREANNQR